MVAQLISWFLNNAAIAARIEPRKPLFSCRSLAHEENFQATGKLTWTQHVELLPAKKSTERRKLERLIVTKKLSKEQIRQAVHQLIKTNGDSSVSGQSEGVGVPSLECIRAPLLRTYSYDKYARYLADIFYLPGVSSYERICSDGLYLNQELLDKGLAQAAY